MILRHMLKDYSSKPWEWDEDYPDDMYGKYFPEDVNALVQIDHLVSEKNREDREGKK